MSGPKSSRYDIEAEQRRKLEEQRILEEKRRLKRERRQREEAERRQREEQERRQREEAERRQREEAARQNRIKQADIAIDTAFANFSHVLDEPEKIPVVEKESATKNEFDGNEILSKLNLLREDSRLSAELQAKVEQVKRNFESLNDSAYRKNFAALSINPLLKKCNEYLELYEKFADLKIEYKVVCEMAGEPEKSFEISQTTIQNIQNEMIRLREKIARADEKAYIGKCLDEVMSEMGYDVIGHREVTKKSGKHFKSELFSYSDGTAVNVTMTDGGHIAMELCGLDDVDRTPDLDESNRLCEHMENFCEDFGEIERRLAQRGVIVRSRIQRLPPSVEYAQILNVNDYEMSDTFKHFNHSSRNETTFRPMHRSN